MELCNRRLDKFHLKYSVLVLPTELSIAITYEKFNIIEINKKTMMLKRRQTSWIVPR